MKRGLLHLDWFVGLLILRNYKWKAIHRYQATIARNFFYLPTFLCVERVLTLRWYCIHHTSPSLYFPSVRVLERLSSINHYSPYFLKLQFTGFVKRPPKYTCNQAHTPGDWMDITWQIGRGPISLGPRNLVSGTTCNELQKA